MTEISQKNYLKKYLSKDDSHSNKSYKKHKKKVKTASNRVKIIDDDVDIHTTFNVAVQEDLMGLQEDAPQIVSIIDERPVELRTEVFRKDTVWTTVNLDTGDKSKSSDSDRSVKQKIYINSAKNTCDSDSKRQLDTDFSPPRSRKDCDYSPPRKVTGIRKKSPTRTDDKKNRDRQESPQRKTCGNLQKNSASDDDLNPHYKSKNNEDYWPPRKHKRRDSTDGDISPPRKREKMFPRNVENINIHRSVDVDNSSKKGKATFENMGQPRQRRKSVDISPSRRPDREYDSPISIFHSKSKPRNDLSPISKGKIYDDLSPNRKSMNTNIYSSSRSNDDLSPDRRSNRKNYQTDCSPPRKAHKNNDRSTKSSDSQRRKTTRWMVTEEAAGPSGKTLVGKTSGLQSAREIIAEANTLKEREDELFKRMGPEVSGQNAAPIMRDKRTGKVRDFGAEAAQTEEKLMKEAKIKEQYDRWGKGTKQVDDYKKKLEEDAHEMSKPLARYANDEDLEEYLKKQEREGDPMLAYIRKKKKKEPAETGKSMKPEYLGEFMPNRFGIRPGHRWDGVDRSNGYEKQWFEVQNSKRARLEDTYKWNTEDM